MGIKKEVTEYHRIAMIKMDTNQQNTILIHSYISEDGRQIEKDYEAGKYRDLEEGMMNWTYANAQYINTEYDGNMTISKSYEYLKTLPQFKGTEDI